MYQNLYVIDVQLWKCKTSKILKQKWSCPSKGQIISKRFFLAEDSSKKRTKTRRILVKTNSFVRFWKNPRLDNLLSKLIDL